LIQAFRATLEETQQADLLVHVIDISDPQWRDTVFAVQKVLTEIGVTDIPIIQVFNKIDLQEGWQPKVDSTEESVKVWISASSGAGLDFLKEAIAAQLHGTVLFEDLIVKHTEAKLRSQLYQLGSVISESVTDEGDWLLKIRITRDQKMRLLP
ncbi:MAG: GTPase HflX, partial [Legionellales bacterium]